MKRILSILLTIILIGTVTVAPVSALPVDSSQLQMGEIADPDGNVYLIKFTAYDYVE